MVGFQSEHKEGNKYNGNSNNIPDRIQRLMRRRDLLKISKASLSNEGPDSNNNNNNNNINNNVITEYFEHDPRLREDNNSAASNERLLEGVAAALRGEVEDGRPFKQRLLVVANRLPVSAIRKGEDSWSLEISAGGLVSALLGVKALEARWIGWAGVNVPDEIGQKALTKALAEKRCIPVFLDEEIVHQYYNGYCNNILWPLFHYLGLPQEDRLATTRSFQSQFEAYQKANQMFADVVNKHYEEGDVVWCHDYHLMFLPQCLKNYNSKMKVGWFLHTPFPSSEIHRTLPSRSELLHAVLAADLVGFHTYDYARHFVSACTRILGLEGTPEGVENQGKLTRVAAFPIGIDSERFIRALDLPQVKVHIEDLQERFKGRKVMLGVDRLDMIKGIPQKILAFEKFLEENPDWRDKVVLLQIAVPTRTDVPEYQNADDYSAAEDGVPSEDPNIDVSTAIVSVATDSDSDDQDDLECLKRVQSLYQPLSVLPPLAPAALSDDDVDDLETVRAIMKRFGDYNEGLREGGRKVLVEGDHASSMDCEGDIANGSIHNESGGSELYPVSQDPNEAATEELIENIEKQLSDFVESSEPDAWESSRLPQKRLSCPPVVQCFIDAIKKNRDLQRFLRGKLIELEAKIEENKKIRNRIKILKDFQASCSRRTGNVLSLKKDPRVQLISAKKSSAPKKSKKRKKVPAMCYGPEENSHVANYRRVLERFPLSLDRKKWSKVERENLLKGIKQQFQEMVLQLSLSIDRTSSEGLLGEADDMDSIISSVKDLEVTPERIRKFLPKVNWDLLASMYVGGHTGAECESRWLNYEDPLINQGAWTKEEDKSLLLIVQDTGIRNWFEIAASLGTSRTPFQCLSRFQRSLNPSMLNSEWTEEEDGQLCSAVTYFGDGNWQYVASVLERRTGTQCSNRWKKSLCPEKKGSFTEEEDIRLTVAVMLFGRKWNQIAKYVPGRIQSQCRDRYLNSLDPSLKWGGWTEEEDLRLEAAIAKHGYCWSKIAEEVPPRTDSQCRKRWKVLCPEQVPLLQEARKKQRSIIGSNFVDRESERPTITLNDFIPLPALASKSDIGASNLPKKRKSSNVPKKTSSKKRAKRIRRCTKEVQDTEVYSDDDFYPVSSCSNLPKKNRSKIHAKSSRNCTQELVDISCSDKVKTCIEGPENQSTCIVNSENQYSDNITLSCFIRNKSNEILSRFTKNLSQTSFSSRITDVPEQVESQNPSDYQSGLSQSYDTVGSLNLFVQPNSAFDRNPEDTNTLTNDDDDDMTLASFIKKECQPAKGPDVCSSKLKTGSVLLNEEHCASKPTIISDNSELSMSKHVEEMETVLRGCVAKPMDTIVEEKDDELSTSPVQNRPRRERKRPSRFL